MHHNSLAALRNHIYKVGLSYTFLIKISNMFKYFLHEDKDNNIYLVTTTIDNETNLFWPETSTKCTLKVYNYITR